MCQAHWHCGAECIIIGGGNMFRKNLRAADRRSMKAGGKKINRELILQGSMVHAILSLAIPVVINSFLQTMYNLTDTYWLGKIGTAELAAINLVTPVQNIIINFGSGITVAGSVLVTQFIGAGKMEEALKMANQILPPPCSLPWYALRCAFW